MYRPPLELLDVPYGKRYDRRKKEQARPKEPELWKQKDYIRDEYLEIWLEDELMVRMDN